MIDLRFHIQESQHHLLAKDRRDHAGPHIQADPVNHLLKMPVLRHSLFRNVHSAEDLRPRHQRLMHFLVIFPHMEQHAVQPHPDNHPVFLRFQMNVTGIFPVSQI